MMWGAGWDNWILGLLMMVLFWGGLVVLAVLALRGWDANQRRGSSSPNHHEAHEILKERFAKGGISDDEFEQRRRVLEYAGQ